MRDKWPTPIPQCGVSAADPSDRGDGHDAGIGEPDQCGSVGPPSPKNPVCCLKPGHEGPHQQLVFRRVNVGEKLYTREEVLAFGERVLTDDGDSRYYAEEPRWDSRDEDNGSVDSWRGRRREALVALLDTKERT